MVFKKNIYIKNGNILNFLKAKSDPNICTIFVIVIHCHCHFIAPQRIKLHHLKKNSRGSIYPRTTLTKRLASQISKSENKSPPPCQILATPLQSSENISIPLEKMLTHGRSQNLGGGGKNFFFRF